MRVLAALSGGVDSAVAAARALDAGHEVTGVHLALARDPGYAAEGARGCCSLDDARDARRIADVLGIPVYVWDLATEFERDVLADFVAEYAAGRTPNPCLRCNEKIKFAAVLERALALGFDAVCTGHYARIVDATAGRELHRAVDPAKDQSYVLGVLDAEQLAGAMFPLGDSVKTDIRAEAAARGLLVADKPDSHDICFIPTGDTAGFLREQLGEAVGPVVDAATGEVVGEHTGAYGVTIGQRRGLRLSRPAADGQPRYVVGTDPVTRTVRVGPRRALQVDRIVARRPRWCGTVPASDPFEASVQVRAHGVAVPATVKVISGDSAEATVEVVLHQPQVGVAPGQAAVIYAGTRVVGSATIASTGGPGD